MGTDRQCSLRTSEDGNQEQQLASYSSGASMDQLCKQHGSSPPSLLISRPLAGPSRQRAGFWGHSSSFPPRSPPSSCLPSFWLPQLPLKVKEQTDKPFPWSLPQRGRLQLESNSESGPGLSLSCECEDRKNIFVAIKSVKMFCRQRRSQAVGFGLRHK